MFFLMLHLRRNVVNTLAINVVALSLEPLFIIMLQFTHVSLMLTPIARKSWKSLRKPHLLPGDILISQENLSSMPTKNQLTSGILLNTLSYRPLRFHQNNNIRKIGGLWLEGRATRKSPIRAVVLLNIRKHHHPCCWMNLLSWIKSR